MKVDEVEDPQAIVSINADNNAFSFLHRGNDEDEEDLLMDNKQKKRKQK